MKIPYSYLRNFLSSELSQSKLVETFTQVGFECDLDGPLIDFDITPNRGDALSLKGLHREFYASQSKKPKDSIPYAKLKFQTDRSIINKIDTSGCGNYHLAIFKGLKSIKELDAKKRNLLTSSGVPLIHPLVDLGNYVMLEIGTPMHVFDLDKLNLPINVVFPSSNGTKLKIIGGDIKDVQSNTLTIQDQSEIQAIAGIIGAQESSVSSQTCNIAVEAAFFYPEKIANQARKYGLVTDASHRFERGVDPKMQKKALERFTFLLRQTIEFDSVDCYSSNFKESKEKIIHFNVKKFNNFSGLTLSTNKIKMLLKNLGFNLSSSKHHNLKFTIPSHRFDVVIEEDLYEEVLRCYGYDKVASNPPKAGPRIKNRKSTLSSRMRAGLVYLGFKEFMHMPFVSEETYEKLNLESQIPAKLLNPINEKEPLLRGSLFGALLEAVNVNIKKGYSAIKIFELGNTFRKQKNSYVQETHIAGLIYLNEPIKDWRSKEYQYDFYSLKSEVLKLCQTLGIRDINLKSNSLSRVFNMNSVDIMLASTKIGCFGEIDLIHTNSILKHQVYGFEFYPEIINEIFKPIKLKKLSKFPLSARDLNIIVNNAIHYGLIENAIASLKLKNLKSMTLIDTFSGKGIPQDSISMTIRFVYQSNTRSLLDSDVSLSMEKIVKIMSKSFKAKIRD